MALTKSKINSDMPDQNNTLTQSTTAVTHAAISPWSAQLQSVGITPELVRLAGLMDTDYPRIYHYLYLQKSRFELKGFDLSSIAALRAITGKVNIPAIDKTLPFVYAALSGQSILLQRLDTIENQDYWHSTYGASSQPITHFIALSGNTESLDYINAYHPDLILGLDLSGRNLAHYAALSGHVDSLEWIHTRHPILLTEVSNQGLHIAHYAAVSANPDCLEWIKNHYPDLLSLCDKEQQNIAHYAAKNDNARCIDWIHQYDPSLLTQLDINGCHGAHACLYAPTTDVLAWLYQHIPALIDSIDNDGATLAHRAAGYGCLNMLKWLRRHHASLLYQKDNDGYSVAHVITMRDDYECWLWLHEPEQQSLLALTDQHDLSPYDHLALMLDSTLLDKFFVWAKHHDDQLPVLKALLIEASANLSLERCRYLILSYKDIWQKLMLHEGLYIDLDMTTIQSDCAPAMRWLAIKVNALQTVARLDADHGVFCDQLQAIISIAYMVAEQYPPYWHAIHAPDALLSSLKSVIDNRVNPDLSRDDICCLRDLIDAYYEGGLGYHSSLTKLVAGKVSALLTLHHPVKYLQVPLPARKWIVGFYGDIPSSDDTVIKVGIDRFKRRYPNTQVDKAIYNGSKQRFPNLSGIPAGAKLTLVAHGDVASTEFPDGHFNAWSPSTLAARLFVDCRLAFNRDKHIAVIVLVACSLGQTPFAQKLHEELALYGITVDAIHSYDEDIRATSEGRLTLCTTGQAAIISRHTFFESLTHNVTAASSAPSEALSLSHVSVTIKSGGRIIA